MTRLRKSSSLSYVDRAARLELGRNGGGGVHLSAQSLSIPDERPIVSCSAVAVGPDLVARIRTQLSKMLPDFIYIQCSQTSLAEESDRTTGYCAYVCPSRQSSRLEQA